MVGVVKVGKWGGIGGSLFDMGIATRLLAIKIRYGIAIDAIQIMYERDGKFEWSPQFGGNGGDPIVIDLQEGEVLTSISGYFGMMGEVEIVRSLTFGTYMRNYGPYGAQEGTSFSLPLEDCQIVGFFGRSGAFLDAIGVYLSPK